MQHAVGPPERVRARHAGEDRLLHPADDEEDGDGNGEDNMVATTMATMMATMMATARTPRRLPRRSPHDDVSHDDSMYLQCTRALEM